MYCPYLPRAEKCEVSSGVSTHQKYWYSNEGSVLVSARVDSSTQPREMSCLPSQSPSPANSMPNLAKSRARALTPLSIFSKPLEVLSKLQEPSSSMPMGFHSFSCRYRETDIPVARSSIKPTSR